MALKLVQPKSQGRLTQDEFLERAKRSFGQEFWEYWIIYLGVAPAVCPKCKTESIRILRLADPSRKVGRQIWSKWYLWCQSCLHGIYCPPGTYFVKKGQPYILWNDRKALEKNLPKALKLIRPAGF